MPESISYLEAFQSIDWEFRCINIKVFNFMLPFLINNQSSFAIDATRSEPSSLGVWLSPTSLELVNTLDAFFGTAWPTDYEFCEATRIFNNKIKELFK